MLGRFLSADTIVPSPGDPQSLNRYTYVRNSPLNRIDPSGHEDTPYDNGGGSPPQSNFPRFSEIAGPALVVVVSFFYEPLDYASTGVQCLSEGCTWGDVALTLAPGSLSAFNKLADVFRAADKVADGVKVVENTEDMVDSLVDAAKVIDCSFSADTPVTTDNGQQTIATLQIGDHVLAYDMALGITGYYTVTAVMIHDDPIVEYLVIDGEQIETTPEHPFYTFGFGWLPAGKLWAGVHIRKADGNYGTVQGIQLVRRDQSMYNLTVAEVHTFFVGEQQWLVHNACGKYMPSPKHAKGGWGSPMDLSDDVAQQVMDKGVQNGKQVYSYHNGNAYAFQPQGGGVYHGYNITGKTRVPTEVLRQWLEQGIISKADYGKMLKWGD